MLGRSARVIGRQDESDLPSAQHVKEIGQSAHGLVTAPEDAIHVDE